MRLSWSCLAVVGAATLCSAGNVQGQVQSPMPPLGEYLEYTFDTGRKANFGNRSRTVFTEVVHTPNAAWTRLFFDDVQLDPGSRVRFTSLFDGEVQELDAAGLRMWSNSSAYFNGDTVLVELIAAPGSRNNQLRMREVQVDTIGAQQIGICGICGVDDRTPSEEDWSARVMNPGVCSAAVFNVNSCLVSAGHCIGGSGQVVQFRVPTSLGNCNIQNPPVAEQFPITDSTFVNGGVGNDWAVMTSGTNSVGQTIYERYGQYRPIASVPANVGDSVQVWGYGASQTCTSNHVQQLSNGTIQQKTSAIYAHTADTTGGNSGSAILHDDEIIGVVTHCPCPNIAGRVDLPAFANAIEELCPNPAPSNDNCSDQLVVGVGTTPFSNFGATTDGPSEAGDCTFFGDGQIQNDVWFGHIATCTGDLTVSLCGSSFNTKLAVYDFPCPTSPGSVLACDVVSCPGENRAEVTIPVVQGQAYRIRVGGHMGDQGDGLLTISCQPAPAGCLGDLNDDNTVDVSDLLVLLGDWGPCGGCTADLNEDDTVDVSDLLMLLGEWGICDN